MAVDRIKHTKPASQRTFLDELEPIPYEISEEELAAMDPRMKKILFGIDEAIDDHEDDRDEPDDSDVEVSAADLLDEGEDTRVEAAVRDEPEEETAHEEAPEDEETTGEPVEPEQLCIGVTEAPESEPVEELHEQEAQESEEEAEEDEPFDPRVITAEFEPRDGHLLIIVFPHREGYAEASNLARNAADVLEKDIEGELWYAVRFDRTEVESLKQLIDALGKRDDIQVVVNNTPQHFGRGPWVPLMYIFDAANNSYSVSDTGFKYWKGE